MVFIVVFCMLGIYPAHPDTDTHKHTQHSRTEPFCAFKLSENLIVFQ